MAVKPSPPPPPTIALLPLLVLSPLVLAPLGMLPPVIGVLRVVTAGGLAAGLVASWPAAVATAVAAAAAAAVVAELPAVLRAVSFTTWPVSVNAPFSSATAFFSAAAATSCGGS